jgi:hypothetical protein
LRAPASAALATIAAFCTRVLSALNECSHYDDALLVCIARTGFH